MATHSSILAWEIPRKAGMLQSTGSHRVRHYCSVLAHERGELKQCSYQKKKKRDVNDLIVTKCYKAHSGTIS